LVLQSVVTQRVEQGGSAQVTGSLEEWQKAGEAAVAIEQNGEEDSRGGLTREQHRLAMWRMDD
jgi:hypothetical protein